MDDTTVPVCEVIPDGMNTTGIPGMTIETLITSCPGTTVRLIKAEKSWNPTEKTSVWEAPTPIFTAQKVTQAYVRDFICPLKTRPKLAAERLNFTASS